MTGTHMLHVRYVCDTSESLRRKTSAKVIEEKAGWLLLSIRQVAACNFELHVLAGGLTPKSSLFLGVMDAI